MQQPVFAGLGVHAFADVVHQAQHLAVGRACVGHFGGKYAQQECDGGLILGCGQLACDVLEYVRVAYMGGLHQGQRLVHAPLGQQPLGACAHVARVGLGLVPRHQAAVRHWGRKLSLRGPVVERLAVGGPVFAGRLGGLQHGQKMRGRGRRL